MSDVEVVETLNTIIRLQSTVINDLFLVLAQHITAEEMERIPVVDRINEAARLRADIDRRCVC
jgi:hypothetical protein